MGKIKEILIDRFDGGMSEDKRVKDANKFSITKHFDTFTYPHKLKPHPMSAAMIDETKAFDIVKFLYAPATSEGTGEYRLYGWGVDDSAPVHGAVYISNIDSNFAADWETPTAYYNSTRARSITQDEYCFFYYKNYIFVWLTNRYICAYDTTGAADWNDTVYDPGGTVTSVCQPVHHPINDKAYFFHNNFIHTLPDGTLGNFDDKTITLPDNLKITAACPFGNYLAIACATLGARNPESIVYLWDLDSTLSNLTERIDFGQGEIKFLNSLDNRLIAVMDFGNVYTPTTGQGNGKVIIKAASGQMGFSLNELTCDHEVTITRSSMVLNNKLYFPMGIDLNSDPRLGIWVVDSSGRITLDYVEEEATSYEGIYAVDNKWLIAHSNDGSVNATNVLNNYSTTNPSIYESLILGDCWQNKKLLSVGVQTEALPADGQVVLKYRKDADLDSIWTTVYTNTTDDSIYHEAINIESSGATLPQFREIQFRIESTGGAVITGLKFKYEEIDSNPS